MSVELELGTYKRIATVTIQAIEKDESAPIPTAVKIGTDVESNKDIYADVVYSQVAV